MSFVEILADATRNKKQGNHRVEINGSIRRFIYYSTCICEVNDNDRTVKIDSSYGTQSTSKNCGLYRKYFVNQLGYKEIQ